MGNTNLDRLCAEYGYNIANRVYKVMSDKAEGHINKSLGILQEDGVYAFFLYQKKEEDNNELSELPNNMLTKATLEPFGKMEEVDPLEAIRGNREKNIKGLSEDLDSLILAKNLLEKTLIYAKYHVQALKKK